MDRIAEGAQLVYIAPQRTARDFEAFRQFGARPVSAALEQGEQAQQARRTLQHVF
jgi:hypothetical protein